MEQSITLERFDNDTAIMQVMTVAEAERAEYEIITTGTRLRGLLVEFYERRGWEALGFASWRAWASARLGQSERSAYRELTAGLVEMELLTHGSNLELGSIPERQLRPLAALKNDPDRIRDAWEDAHEIAAERGETFTARHVAEAVRTLATPSELRPTPEPTIEIVPVTPMAVHFSSATPEHYTPAHIITLAREVMGGFDLDPASCAEANEIVQAAAWYGLDHPSQAMRDGLSGAWAGRVWMNPPYGDVIGDWMHRLKHQYEAGFVTEAIALIPARTDTAWFQDTVQGRTFCLVRGRLKFGSAENSAPFPSALVYYGENVGRFYAVFGKIGMIR
jgi:hypothetical protein